MSRKKSKPPLNTHRDTQYTRGSFADLPASVKNRQLMWMYTDRLINMASTAIQWHNMPVYIDMRYIEYLLTTTGAVVFFLDERAGKFAVTRYVEQGGYLHTNYDEPRVVTARAMVNSYQYAGLTPKNSVIIYNNMLKRGCMQEIDIYASKLADIHSTIDVNVLAQKTPYFMVTDEKTQLTMKNIYAKYEGNEPLIAVNKSTGINGDNPPFVLQTNAPYVADQLEELKQRAFNEACNALGIESVNSEKRERMITDEVNLSQGSTNAQLNARLVPRQNACDMINALFGDKLPNGPVFVTPRGKPIGGGNDWQDTQSSSESSSSESTT